MDCEDFLVWICVVVIIIFVIQFVRLLFADADLGLLWASRFGKKPSVLANQVVWITGASSGIGEYLAYELVQARCRLILSARRQEELERVKKQCLLSGRIKEDDILILPLDIQKTDSHQDAMDKALERFSKIDILVNNAGRSQRALVKNTVLEVDRQMLELNVIGTLSLTKVVLPHMLSRKSGHIVVTSSVAGKIGAPFSASYSATKFALQGWFDAARIELVKDNIDITMVCPGPVFSKVRQEAFTDTPGKKHGIEMENEPRVSTARCAQLMTVAMANKCDEVWIALQPVLFLTYIAQYAPDIFRKLSKVLGRKEALLKKLREGGISASASK